MTNFLYPYGKEGFLDGSVNILADDIRVALVDDYIYSGDHLSLADVTDVAGASIISRSDPLENKTVTGGIFNADTAIFTAVTAGDPCEQILIYKDAEVDADTHLIAYIDTAASLPVTPNGGDIRVNWDTGPYKIFAL